MPASVASLNAKLLVALRDCQWPAARATRRSLRPGPAHEISGQWHELTQVYKLNLKPEVTVQFNGFTSPMPKTKARFMLVVCH